MSVFSALCFLAGASLIVLPFLLIFKAVEHV